MVCFLNCLLYVICVVELLVSSVICRLQGLSYLCAWLYMSFLLFCSFITIFIFILNYVLIVTFWILTYYKIWILLNIYCFIWNYWIIYFVTCLEVFWISSRGGCPVGSMMASSNGNIFRVTGPLCGEFTGPGEFPAHRPVTRSFDVFFDLGLNKWLSKQPWGWWFETLSWSLWRQCNVVGTGRQNDRIRKL